jgi:hypothetical protein
MIIILRRSNKLGSRIIRLFTREAASHIGVSFDGVNVYHSDVSGCRVETIEQFSKDNVTLVRHYAVPTAVMWMRANEKLGTKYDMLGIIGFGLYLMLKMVGIRTKVPLMNPRWMFCSEYAEYILLGSYNSHTPVEVVTKYESTLRK